jgi:cytochrome c oxidase assembly factor CtaG
VLIVLGAAGPFAWVPHLLTWAVLVVGTAAVVLGHRRLTAASLRPTPWTRTQVIQFAGAVLAAVVALTWPLADLAAHWSLTALVLQRVILVLAVAPLLLLGLPYDVVQWATRPAPVDAVLLALRRPPVAIVTVTALLIGSVTPFFVHAQSVSFPARGGLAALTVVAGLILWMPVVGRIPGIPRPKPVVRFAYLVGQAVVPAFLSFIYIFSRHPLYPEFARSHQAIGLRPLTDQQIAGFVSKLSMLLVLLTVGAVVLARASTSDDEFGGEDQLVWADVERQFERADRRGRGRRFEAEPDGGEAPASPDAGTPQTPTRAPDRAPDPSERTERSGPNADPPNGDRPPDQP